LGWRNYSIAFVRAKGFSEHQMSSIKFPNQRFDMLELHNLTKDYGEPGTPGHVQVLKLLSLKLAAGRSLAIVGPSGCGKSTLLNIVGGLDRPTGGQVIFMGRDLTSLPEAELAQVRNQLIGYVFQMHHLLPQCTVLENVLVPTLAYPDKHETHAKQQRALKLLDKVGLQDLKDRRPGELSGGQRQRVAVARALINQPKLLLADEPTGSLDHESARNTMDLLNTVNRTEHVTLVVVTHALDLARQFDEICTLRDGCLHADQEGQA
jgi:ABC-type lipoprotein export system ATPase subunit